MKSGICPNCDGMIDVGDSPLVGHYVKCQSCDAELIIVWLNPLELDFMYYSEDEDYIFESHDDFES
jgi:hypothetical protein